MFGRKVMGGACAAALALFATANVASAEERQFGYSLTITGSSDYLFRGISFTQNDPTANIYNEFTYGIAYLGLWTSTINNGDLGPWEQDIYLGIRPVTGPISWDISALYYLYGNRANSSRGSNAHGLNPGHGDVFDTSYAEFKIGATTPIRDGFVVGANVYLTPDQGYAATDNISIEGTVAYDLPKYSVFAPQFTGLVGWSHSGTNSTYKTGYWLNQQEYAYWNAGVKVNVDKYFMDFRYSGTSIDTDNPDRGKADDRFVFSAGVSLTP
ncbi:TorF family putative porin [Hyphomicrobium sp. 2TAF46]|uniref:TorF family putative porin n=1 Tax=Hyphomicrobium sp. 2TAF46 TaxID=3233019 RepID=UPI003F90232A